ncbi:MAG TPA: choice-of-anchor tandem repeat GloVer-containing protein [Terriglobales bacterium]
MHTLFDLFGYGCRRLGVPHNLSFALAALIALTLTVSRPALGQTETVLHSFSGKDGSLPGQRLTLDSAGNLYGSTVGNFPSIGSIFELTPTGALKVLYAFTDGQNRLFTTGRLVLDSHGNLYGVDQTGGQFGEGSIFNLTPSGVFTVLYSFTGEGDGAFPNGVISDQQGNFYGTTNQGGTFNQGTVFRFRPGRGVTVLYTFMGQADGGEPFDSALYRDPQGNLYGTTMFDGGIMSLGVIFKVTPDGTESVLHTFLGGSDGAHPKGSLISDGKGNLYGSTSSGERLSGGTVFRITTSGVLTELHTFSGPDGYDPNAGLAMDAQGNLFGTTFSGGSSNEGVVFEITPQDTETVLHDFSGTDGSTPYNGLITDPLGNLYGTTGFGGVFNQGTVFKVTQ